MTAAETQQPTATGEAEAFAALAAAIKQASAEDPVNVETALDTPEPDYQVLAAEYKDQSLRLAAELENTRRRADREKQEANKYAVTNFARDLVSVYENLTRASGSITAQARAADAHLETLAVGVEMTLGELTRVFEKHHIRRLDPMGEPFDHNFHQAMRKVETTEHPAGTVVQVMQAAYVLHDRLLQPAFVAVATAPAVQGTSSNGTPQHVDTQA
jgi:molecular chaperone GrpE